MTIAGAREPIAPGGRRQCREVRLQRFAVVRLEQTDHHRLSGPQPDTFKNRGRCGGREGRPTPSTSGWSDGASGYELQFALIESCSHSIEFMTELSVHMPGKGIEEVWLLAGAHYAAARSML
jgi:hypothetical protein